MSSNLTHDEYRCFQESERVVSREEGIALAKEHGCLFLECSARTRENVEQCFEELALKVQNHTFYALYSVPWNLCCIFMTYI